MHTVINPTLAQKVLAVGFDSPIFPISVVQKMSGVTEDQVRTFVKRRHAPMRFTKPQGHGVRTLYAPQDVFEIMAISELSLLGVAPKSFGDLAEIISNLMISQIRELAGVFGNTKTDIDYQRYVVIFYDETKGKSHASLEVDPRDLKPDPPARIVVDCRLLAIKAIQAFANYAR